MSAIYPFRAYRYQLNDKKIQAAVCPPYDVIGAVLARQLRKNPANAIHIELPLGSDNQKYILAKNVWDSWKKNHLVHQDPVPSFYVYEQVFKAGGKRFSRTGFFCELQVEEPGKGSVLRHELTLAGPKADRLNLIRNVRINTSPIFGLFADGEKKVRTIMNRIRRVEPLVQIQDREKVIHKLWRCADPAQVEIIEQALERTPVLIADGHHRYETAWNYFSERRSNEGEEGPASRALFFLCPLEDPGLVIFPTHRVLKNWTLDQILDRLLAKKDVFQVRPLKGKKDAVPKAPNFIATDGKKAFQANVRPASAKNAFPGKPRPYTDLVLNHIHSLLLPDKKKEDFIYTHEARQALALARKNKTAAILVPPTTVKELNGIVTAGELMPQKSTYFYPKIITGLVFRSLD